MSQNKVKLITDGSCRNGYENGGWAAILLYERDGKTIQRIITGHIPGLSTNIRCEMTAVIRGLGALKRPCEVLLVTDLQMIERGITEWLPRWVIRGWRKSNGKQVDNVDLWAEIYDLSKKHNVTVEWTKGHIGHYWNERADELAGRARLGQLTNEVKCL